MKKYLVIIVGTLILSACYTTNPDVPEQKKAISEMLMQQVNCWNKGDIAGFMNGYLKDSSMQFIGKKGVRRGWKKTFDAYRKHYPGKDSMGTLQFELDSIEFLDKDAILGHITGKWKLIRKNDTPGGYFSLITRKTAEGPKIIIDHTW